jgi:preprotein translocase SecF subunit
MKHWPLIKVLPTKTNFHFTGPSRIFFILSLIACVVSIFLSVYPGTPPCGGLNCGVDFKGGSVLEMSTAPKPMDLAAVRAALSRAGLKDVQVQALGASAVPTAARVRFETPRGADANATVARVQRDLVAEFPGATFKPREVVGPKVSGELFGKGILALVGAIGFMLIYIWFRFGLQFGIGAVLALFHDVILTFGLFAVFKLEFTMTSVAAILSIIGYSMNDTVVVLDRIRENMRKFKKMSMGEIVDLSVNETLSRTIITGVTGVMALAALLIFGGPAMHTFSIAMIFGIIIGTYSSIYIAGAFMQFTKRTRGGEDEASPIDLSKGTRSARV